MNLSQQAHLRIIHQQLPATSFKTAHDIVSWFGAVQAQEYALAKWALGQRLAHVTDSAIETEFTNGNLLRTHVLRPTWHFVVPENIFTLLQLTAPRVHAINAYMYKKMELDAKVFNRCHDIISKVLEGNKQLTRNAINDVFKQKKIHADGIRLSCIMMHAELEGLICSGARQGNQFTYALLQERVTGHKPKTTEEALAEFTKTYFQSRGPATLKDFSTWSGLTMSDCKKGMHSIKEDLNHDVMNGQDYYFMQSASEPLIKREAIYLLPIYDELVMGYKNRDAILQFSTTLKPKPKFRFDNAILSGTGQIIGTWRRTPAKNTIDLAYDFFKPPTKKQFSEFEKAIRAFETFTELPVNYLRQK